MNKKITKYVSIFILTGFMISGLFFIGNLLHELSHKNDLKNYINEGYLCVLGIDQLNLWESGGMYTYSYNISNEREIEKISRYTEIKAYSINILLIILITIATLIYLEDKWRD